MLIAEDERDNYLLLKTYLERKGAKCAWARDGIEVVQKVSENVDWDLVLMDIKMPRMDGYSAYRQVRKMEAKLPVIATTAFAMSGDEIKLKEFGFDNYVSKPINFATLDSVSLPLIYKIVINRLQ